MGDPAVLVERLDLRLPLLGVYDAPSYEHFEPIVRPHQDKHECVFAFFDNWLDGETLLLGEGNYGCGGAGRALGNLSFRSRDDFLNFLVDDEGLKSSIDLMGQWVDRHPPYRQVHPYLLIGPLKDGQDNFLKTVTFLVNPDQLSALIIGAHYHHSAGEPLPVLAPFGSGCMELLPVFDDLDVPQSVIGTTDLAMRQHLPPSVLSFTVTKPMYERLCSLDESSFLFKPFLKRLRRMRGDAGLDIPPNL